MQTIKVLICLVLYLGSKVDCSGRESDYEKQLAYQKQIQQYQQQLQLKQLAQQQQKQKQLSLQQQELKRQQQQQLQQEQQQKQQQQHDLKLKQKQQQLQQEQLQKQQQQHELKLKQQQLQLQQEQQQKMQQQQQQQHHHHHQKQHRHHDRTRAPETRHNHHHHHHQVNHHVNQHQPIIRVLQQTNYIPQTPPQIVHTIAHTGELHKGLQHGETWVVLIYAPWCGHSRRAIREWNHVAEGMTRIKSRNVTVAAFNVKTFDYYPVPTTLYSRYIPTVRLFAPEVPKGIEYEGRVATHDVLQWIQHELYNIDYEKRLKRQH